MWNIILILILALSVLIVAAIRYGESRWESSTRELRGRLEAARVALPTRTYSEQELEGLPAPVQRYFRTALTPGQPMIEAVSVEHAGTFNMSETGENWRSFVSKQRVIVRRPGFDWDARIRMAPGVNVYVHDAYVAGEGILHAALFGLATLVNMRGTPEAARGELMRFFVEAAWYPTALLPSHGVKWEAVDDTSAKATMSDGTITLTMLFRFDKDGLIQSARASKLTTERSDL